MRPDASDEATAGEPRVFAYATPAAAIVDAIVVGDEVFADAAPTARESCLRLAHAAGTDVLAIRLAQMRGDPAWRFVAADPAPVLDAGAPLAALVRLLERRGGVP